MSKQETPAEQSSRKRLPSWMTSGSAVIGVVLVIAWGLMSWPVTTRIAFEGAVSRAEMTLGISPTQQILNTLEIETLSVGQFSKVELHPSSLTVADPTQYEMETDSFPPPAWQPLTVFGYLGLFPKTQGPLLTILPQNKEQKLVGILDPIHVREESRVIFETDRGDPRTITIKISGAGTRIIFTPSQPFELVADDTKLEGIKDFPFPDESSLTFRPSLPAHRSKIDIRGSEQQLVLTMKIASSSNNTVFAKQPFPVKELGFSRQDASGNRVTSLVTSGVLTYPDFPDLPSKTIPPTDFVGIKPKKAMMIKRMTLLRDTPGMKLWLDGKAKHVQSGSAEFPTDHRLSKFDVWWHHPKVQSLFGLWKDMK